MNKRGAGQVEIIIAFVLFIGFVMFALYFFSPLRSERLYDSSLDYVLREVIRNASVEIDQRTLSVSTEIVTEVVSISTDKFEKDTDRFKVVKEDGEAVDYWFNEGDIVFNRAGERFFFIQFSEGFQSVSGGLPGLSLTPDVFSLGTSSTRQVISEKKFLELNSSYNSDYEGLKKQFNLPGRIDFAIGLSFDNKKIESKREIPSNLKVTASSKRIEILKSDEELTFGEIAASVW